MSRSPVVLGRKPLRAYVFLVFFACALAITVTALFGRTPLDPQKSLSQHLPYRHQAPLPDSAPERPAPHLEYELHPDSTPLPVQQQSRPAHTLRPDGLLQINLDGRHPILDLIDRAEHEWKAKLARASRTLPEAVREYHRRYAQAPPPGFDRWWAYVTKHHVQLPDEYDQIYHDLAPFWGIEPVRLQTIQRDWEGHVHSYTLAKSSPSDTIHVANQTLPDDEDDKRRLLGGAYRLIRLLAEVEEDLPVFRAVFTPYDNPNVFLTEEMRRRAVDAGKSGNYMDIDEDLSSSASGWLSACHADSIANKGPVEPETPRNKTFIYDHLLTMDPCAHPSLLSQHGQFLSHDHGPSVNRYPVPQFSYCSTRLHADIRVPHPSSWISDVEGEGEGEGVWENREDDRLLWRGTTTGIYHSQERPWRDSQRERLVEMVERPVGNMDILVSDVDGEDKERMRVESVKKIWLDHAMFDIAFAGSPNQCEPETCVELEQMFDWRKPMSIKDAGKYKYVLDVDGNGWSSRFKRLMTTNALIFKSTIYPEWFTDRLMPWVHYVPVQVDYSDLYDAVAFFRGDLTGRGAHEDLAAKIALAGREWSLRFWREEDMIAYLFRLFLEYGRVMSEDRNELNFEVEDA